MMNYPKARQLSMERENSYLQLRRSEAESRVKSLSVMVERLGEERNTLRGMLR